MFLNPGVHLELLKLRTQLRDGVISATDAAHQAADIVFAEPMAVTPSTTIWRDYDEAITKATMQMLETLIKL